MGTRDIKCCIRQIQELIITRLNQAVANKLISSVDYLRESFVGTLERCLQSLEKSQDASVHITSNYLKQVLERSAPCVHERETGAPGRPGQPGLQLGRSSVRVVLPFCDCLEELFMSWKIQVSREARGKR